VGLISPGCATKASREKRDFRNDFKLIWPVQSLVKKYSGFFCGKSPALSPHPVPIEGR
jgi:hypothetical protein